MSRLLIKTCIENHITPNNLMVLYAMVFPKEERILGIKDISFHNLHYEELVHLDYSITDKGKRLIVDYASASSILEGKGKTRTKQIDAAIIEAEVSNWILEYRELFKGLKMGAMGDKKGCISKMITFYRDYPEYANKEVIFKAVGLYISSVNDTRYLMRADYFISKNDQNGNKVSNLAIHAEEVDLEKQELTHNTIMI